MGAFDQTLANQDIDAILGTTALVATTAPIHTRFMTANGSATAAGTELASSGGYSAGSGAPTVTFAAASAGAAASSSAVSVSNMPAATIVGIELWDSNGTPKRKLWSALTAAKTTNSGDTFLIPSGSITVSLP